MSRLAMTGRAAVSPGTSLQAALWTRAAAHHLRRDLKGGGFDALDRIPRSPPVGDHHRVTVSRVLRLMHASCLVRSAILQRWDADHGRPRFLVIGVARPDRMFAAHAWLEGERPPSYFVELHRRPAPTGG